MGKRIIVNRADLSSISIEETASPDLQDGQVRVAVELFGLSANNVSYAMVGDLLGYWAFFPVDDEHGCIPVWGFAEVTESFCDEVPVGTRLFGYLPMGEELVLTPTAVTDLAFTDGSAHRQASHPWYNRYYRCDADPLWSADTEPVQATMWALLMTGWALADQVGQAGITSVVVSSASSKTALSLAWSLQQYHPDVTVVGLTSDGNVPFVDGAKVYDHVVTYNDLAANAATLDMVTGPAAFVDAAGSPAIKEQAHAALGDRLTDSFRLGGTHQGGTPGTGELVGPEPRLFFIPAVAEELAAATSLAAYHQDFAQAWHRFLPWIDGLLTVEHRGGADAVVAAFRDNLAGTVGPEEARLFTW